MKIDVPGYEGIYYAKDDGYVYPYFQGKSTIEQPLHPVYTNGYLRIVLCKNGIREPVALHRIIATCFIETTNYSLFVNHINGIKFDNRPKNLEWMTQKDNIIHAVKSGLLQGRKGELHSRAKLTNEQVKVIRQCNSSHSETGKEYGVSRQVIFNIRKGLSYK